MKRWWDYKRKYATSLLPSLTGGLNNMYLRRLNPWHSHIWNSVHNTSTICSDISEIFFTTHQRSQCGKNKKCFKHFSDIFMDKNFYIKFSSSDVWSFTINLLKLWKFFVLDDKDKANIWFISLCPHLRAYWQIFGSDLRV